MPARAQGLLALSIRTAIPRDAGRTIGAPPLPFLDPDRAPVPGQPRLGVDGDALETVNPIRMHGPQALHAAKEALPTLGGDSPPADPAQDVHRRPAMSGARLRRPVPHGRQGVKDRRGSALSLLSRAGLCAREVRQAALPLPLGRNAVLPGLAPRDVLGRDRPRLAQGPVILGADHHAMIGAESCRTPRGGQGGQEALQECGPLLRLRGPPRQQQAGGACQETAASAPAPPRA